MIELTSLEPTWLPLCTQEWCGWCFVSCKESLQLHNNRRSCCHSEKTWPEEFFRPRQKFWFVIPQCQAVLLGDNYCGVLRSEIDYLQRPRLPFWIRQISHCTSWEPEPAEGRPTLPTGKLAVRIWQGLKIVMLPWGLPGQHRKRGHYIDGISCEIECDLLSLWIFLHIDPHTLQWCPRKSCRPLESQAHPANYVTSKKDYKLIWKYIPFRTSTRRIPIVECSSWPCENWRPEYDASPRPSLWDRCWKPVTPVKRGLRMTKKKMKTMPRLPRWWGETCRLQPYHLCWIFGRTYQYKMASQTETGGATERPLTSGGSMQREVKTDLFDPSRKSDRWLWLQSLLRVFLTPRDICQNIQ